MTPIKSLFLTLSLLALLAANAAAQANCPRSYWIQLPSGSGWNSSSFYVKIDNVQRVSLTSQSGGWYSFTLSSPNDLQYKSFHFQNENRDADEVRKIGINKWAATGNANSVGQFQCSTFGGNVERIYIYVNPLDPNQTMYSTNPPSARYFYFLPPEDYITNSPYFWYEDESGNMHMKKVNIDGDRCGWYKMVFFGSNEVPEGDGLIMFSPKNPNDPENPQYKEVLGSKGVDETKFDKYGYPENFINLKHMFDSLLGENVPGSIFFVAEGDWDRWSKTDPNIDEPSRCSYNLAAIIYYKGQTGNSFSHWADNNSDAEGVCKGYVRPELGADGRMQWSGRGSCGSFGWENGTDFDNAFKKTNNNQQLCYDMPFQRRTGGLWEFDALYLCRDGSLDFTGSCRNAGGRTGGFYLPIRELGGSVQRTYNGDFGVGPKDCFNQWCYDRGWMGGTCEEGMGGTSSMGEGNLDGLTTPAAINAEMNKYCVRQVQERDFAGYGKLLGTMPGGSPPSNVTGLLCFESHAKFTYEKGQEFFFRGDDDIWVFINKRLVIDLGGNHGPAPGYVKLDTINTPIKLVEGDDYDIDIFFCDRRGPGANVRISTDMYISQKSLLYTEPDRSTGESQICAVIDEGGNDCTSKMGGGGGSITLCGPQFNSNNSYSIEFYAVNKDNVKDTVWLKGGASRCSNGTTSFTCYEGIKVNNAIYSCGGKTKCQKDQAATELVKGWPNTKNEFIVYAALTKTGVRIRYIEIDRITPVPEEVKVVWGTLTDVDNAANKPALKNSYNENTADKQEIIAGRRTPIYVASGSWSNGTFNYATDAVSFYTISNCAGLKSSGLTLYKSKEGNDEKCSGDLPRGGIDTLWAEGVYSIGTKEFTINTESGAKKKDPAMVLTVYQPVLKFMENNEFKTQVANPDGYQWFGYDVPPYVTSPLDIYIAAWDPRKNVLCSHCNFPLDQISSTNSDEINQIGGEGIVLSDKLQMKDGILTTSIAGYYQVLDPDKASWTVFYGELKYGISATWTGLEFKDAPVPMPLKSHIYDRNGDGIGDSLRIEYNKSFRGDNGVIRDSTLLVLLEVIWEKKGDTIRYHHPDYPVDSLKVKAYVEGLYKDPEFFTKNSSYWKERVEGDNVIVLKDKMFSRDILTYAYFNDKTDKSKIISYTPFLDDDIFTYSEVGYSRDIFDSIPPIVVKAVYTANENANCISSKDGCREKLNVYLSEPVFAAYEDISSIKNPFSYCLRSQQFTTTNSSTNCPTFLADEDRYNQNWDNLGIGINNPKWDWELPAINQGDTATSVTYIPSNSINKMVQYLQGPKGDSTVNMFYRAVKNSDGTTSRMPKGSDWIKIRESSSVFVDAAGNKNNPREIGVLIVGKNYYTKTPVKIGEVDPKGGSPIRDIFEGNGDIDIPWMDVNKLGPVADSLFNDKYGRITEFLPIPKDNSFSDTAKYYYPGTIGIIFGVADNIRDKVTELSDKCRSADDCTITTMNGTKFSDATDDEIAEGITMHASAYYHTNLGNYVAHRDPVTGICNDPIFKDKEGNGNCLSNAYNFYLAWNMKTNKGRFVGTGAYVAISKFHWRLEYKEKGVAKVYKSSQDEFIEMFGVKRKGK